LRIGFAAVTTRGCTVAQAKAIAALIDEILKDPTPDNERYHKEVLAITSSWKDVMTLEF
jgi:glycine/serine hydroxymethyltransferase